METVESVALWVGLLVGMASVVLAGVALWFTSRVDKRSNEVTFQTVQSLQKIESTVERMSGETTDLIKVAWERLLGRVDTPGMSLDETAVRAIAQGVSAEVGATLSEHQTEEAGGDTARMLEGIAASLESVVHALDESAEQASPLDTAVEAVARLGAVARELAYQLADGGRHLTRGEFTKLRHPAHGEVADAVNELRSGGLLVPLRGRDEWGEPVPVYWFPPGLSRYVKPALALVDFERDPMVTEQVAGLLHQLGWQPARGDSD